MSTRAPEPAPEESAALPVRTPDARLEVASPPPLRLAVEAGPGDAARVVTDADVAWAKEHFAAATTHYAAGAYDAALEEFERAYDAAPHWKTLYNIGHVHLQRRDYRAATDALKAYLREGGDQVPEARRREVEQELAALRARLGD